MPAPPTPPSDPTPAAAIPAAALPRTTAVSGRASWPPRGFPCAERPIRGVRGGRPRRRLREHSSLPLAVGYPKADEQRKIAWATARFPFGPESFNSEKKKEQTSICVYGLANQGRKPCVFESSCCVATLLFFSFGIDGRVRSGKRTTERKWWGVCGGRHRGGRA